MLPRQSIYQMAAAQTNIYRAVLRQSLMGKCDSRDRGVLEEREQNDFEGGNLKRTAVDLLRQQKDFAC